MLKKVRFEGAPVSDGEYDATITTKEVRRTLGCSSVGKGHSSSDIR
jgi:hypothetical protein